MTGIRVHHDQNRCSRWPESAFSISGIGVHVETEWVFTMDRNTQTAALLALLAEMSGEVRHDRLDLRGGRLRSALDHVARDRVPVLMGASRGEHSSQVVAQRATRLDQYYCRAADLIVAAQDPLISPIVEGDRHHAEELAEARAREQQPEREPVDDRGGDARSDGRTRGEPARSRDRVRRVRRSSAPSPDWNPSPGRNAARARTPSRFLLSLPLPTEVPADSQVA